MKETKENMKIVLDIDGLLALKDGEGVKKNNPNPDPVHMSEEHFLNVEFEFDSRKYKYLHYLLPGCMEFLQALLTVPNLEVFFFSSAVEPRNLNLVKQLKENLLKYNNSLATRTDFTVFSRKHCFDTTRVSWDYRDALQPIEGGFFGNLKKDLRIISLGKEKYLQYFNHILRQRQPNTNLDEDERITLASLEKSFPEILTSNTINQLANTILIDDDKSYVFSGQVNNLIKTREPYDHDLRNIVNREIDESFFVVPNNKGIFRKSLFEKSNALFLATGLLFYAINKANELNKSLSYVLGSEQKTINPDPLSYDYDYDFDYFIQGMKILQNFNPDIKFAISSSS